MQESKPTSTPVDPNSKLQPVTNQDEPFNQTKYQLVVGSLMHLGVSTRPDTYSLCFEQPSKVKLKPPKLKEHWTALKQVKVSISRALPIMRYCMYKQEGGSEKCIGYSDADWAGDFSDRVNFSVHLYAQ